MVKTRVDLQQRMDIAHLVVNIKCTKTAPILVNPFITMCLLRVHTTSSHGAKCLQRKSITFESPTHIHASTILYGVFIDQCHGVVP